MSPDAISASDPVMVEMFSRVKPATFARLITRLQCEGADRPCGAEHGDRVSRTGCCRWATYWRTNLTMRQLAAVFRGLEGRPRLGLSRTWDQHWRYAPLLS